MKNCSWRDLLIAQDEDSDDIIALICADCPNRDACIMDGIMDE